MSNKPDDAVKAARRKIVECLRVTGALDKISDHTFDLLIDDIDYFIRQVCKPDLPKLLWSGPFRAEQASSALWYVVDGTHTTIMPMTSKRKATSLAKILNFVWDAQQGGE